MRIATLAFLVSCSLTSNTYALDLGKALEGAIKDKIQESTGATNTDKAAPSTTESTAATATNDTAAAKPQINWKSPSRDEEIAIGREVTGSLLGAAPLVKDDALQQYVNKVGRWIASQSERPDLPWRFGVIESSDLNAFAAPGGYVLITKGLYQTFQNEAQLAGVLGHEIAHIVKKHQLKVMQKQALLDMGAGLLGDKYGSSKLSKKAINTGAEISARNLDKSAEYEADRMGMILAYRAGYDVYGLPEVLQNMAQINKSDNSVALLFKTHPHPDDRLAQLGESAGTQLDALKPGKTLEKRLYPLR
ncbi:M48 family metalloprotease [Methylotenera sp. N17]|uniref:M48 family metalloprotease n=1 Tax=Methylotenera sp. N17 TaxID=1502761 RepID=UPI000647FD74|nr:M48 family metalloprotease [Methylotenera sp. N17]